MREGILPVTDKVSLKESVLFCGDTIAELSRVA